MRDGLGARVFLRRLVMLAGRGLVAGGLLDLRGGQAASSRRRVNVFLTFLSRFCAQGQASMLPLYSVLYRSVIRAPTKVERPKAERAQRACFVALLLEGAAEVCLYMSAHH